MRIRPRTGIPLPRVINIEQHDHEDMSSDKHTSLSLVVNIGQHDHEDTSSDRHASVSHYKHWAARP